MLFLMYINELCSICKYTTPILFADDTNMFSSGKDLKVIENHVNDELSNISEWLKVIANYKQNSSYDLQQEKTCDLKMNIVAEGQAIDEVKKTKFLVVINDSKLNWKEHISYISGKLSHSIGMIIKARHFLNNHGLISLCYSFLYPYLSYCNHIWGSTYKTNLKKTLTSLQNKVIRIILHMNARKNCDAMYNELGIIKFVNINKYLIGRFMVRVYHGQVPEFLSPFFVRNCDIHQHETRLAGHFHIPPVKLDLSKTGIKYEGVIIYYKKM